MGQSIIFGCDSDYNDYDPDRTNMHQTFTRVVPRATEQPLYLGVVRITIRIQAPDYGH